MQSIAFRIQQSKTIIAYILYGMFLSLYANAQNVDVNSCGRIVNTGEIRIKGTTITASGSRIENRTGLMVFGDDTEIRQDTLLGNAEYIKNIASSAQKIPQITHSVVYFLGSSVKALDTTYNGNNFVSLDTIHTASGTDIQIHKPYPLLARGRMYHFGSVNRVAGNDGAYLADGSLPQLLTGSGTFKTFGVNNPAGLDMLTANSIVFENTLALFNGQYRNSLDNNPLLKNNGLIIRRAPGSLAIEQRYEQQYSVKYIGDAPMLTSIEIPQDTSSLKSLTVQNNIGITLNRTISVNDSLVVGTSQYASNIFTNLDSLNKNILRFMTASKDPVYENHRSEVVGTFHRPALRVGGSEPMILSNKYTYVRFASQANLNGASELYLDNTPSAFPTQLEGNTKAKRRLYLTALDAQGNLVVDKLRYTMGYAWIHTPSNPLTHESNSLDINRALLQVWKGNIWESQRGSIVPAQYDSTGWYYSSADTVSRTGYFAIGLPIPLPIALNAKMILEGAYRNGTMATDLQKRNLLPRTPPALYPYTLDPTRALIDIDAVPDNVVDWVVVELRKNTQTSVQRFYQTAFLRQDGQIVNLDGITPLTFPRSLDTGNYYVVIRHRNHLSVISSDRYAMYYDIDNPPLLDLTQPSFVFGAEAVLKPVDRTASGVVLFSLPSGDINGDGRINIGDRLDYDAIWQRRDAIDYSPYDTDLSGIVTTRDMNKAWNNRGRQANVP